MKSITFCVLIVTILCAGCFDGERGILTGVLVDPAPVDEAPPVEPMVVVDAFSDVKSPIPQEIQYALWGQELDDAFAKLQWWEEEVTSRWEEPETIQPEDLRRPLLPNGGGNICELVEEMSFYGKYIDADGIAIIASVDRGSFPDSPYQLSWISRGVPDELLYATREIILIATSKMPQLRRVMTPENGYRYVLVGSIAEVTLPQELSPLGRVGGFAHLGLMVGGIEWHSPDVLAAIRGTPTTGGAWADGEKVLSVRTVVHELAHGIHWAFDEHPHLFPNFSARLEAAYAKALTGDTDWFGLPTSHFYLNAKEYWAVGADMWFRDMHGSAHVVGNALDARVRESFKAHNPALYALLAEVFPVVDMHQWIFRDMVTPGFSPIVE